MDKNTGQKNSPGYRLAALGPDFLLGDSMRGVRLQLEYEKAEERLRAWVVRSTIVVSGSARVRPRGNSHKAESSATLWPGAVTPRHRLSRLRFAVVASTTAYSANGAIAGGVASSQAFSRTSRSEIRLISFSVRRRLRRRHQKPHPPTHLDPQPAPNCRGGGQRILVIARLSAPCELGSARVMLSSELTQLWWRPRLPLRQHDVMLRNLSSLAAAEGGALRDGTWNDRVPRAI
jgi:hypothetical protein